MHLWVIDRDGTGRRIDAEPGESLMLTLLWNDFEIAAACGGVANCGTCHVYVDEAWLDHLAPIEADEQQVLDNSAHRRSNSRLSCQAKLVESIGGMCLS